MTKRRLKEWVIPTLGIIVLCGALLLYYILGNVINESLTPEPELVTSPFAEETKKVQGNVESVKIIKPFTSDKVTISKYYYNDTDDAERQQQSLIKYDNIYMPNTGILYTSEETFDVVAVLDGKVTSVKEDEILGNIIEIEHDNNLVSIYQSVKDIKVATGDTVTQGDIIASSGSNKLDDSSANCLHFETYKEGNIMNPEDFYNLELNNN